MAQPLFIDAELEFEKTAAEAELPDDPNQWPQEILQELYKQVPYIADFQPHVQMERVEGEKGYGFGHVEVTGQTEMQQGTPPDQAANAGLRAIRIPVIIKEGKLQPFDVLVSDDAKVRPLTEGRLRQAIFRPQAFDVTARTPGDQSMIGQLYPPYRQNYGFGGGGVAMNAGMGKEGSALEEFLKEGSPKVTTGGYHPYRMQLGHPTKGKMDVTFGIHESLVGQIPKDKAQQKDFLHSHMGKKVVILAQEGNEPKWSKEKTAAAIDDYLAGNHQHGRLGKTSIEGELSPDGNSSVLTDFVEKTAGVEFVAGGSVLQHILPTINVSDYLAFTDTIRDPAMQLAMMKNAYASADSLKLLLEYTPEKDKTASALPHFIKPTVGQVTRVDGGYTIKIASHLYWEPTVEFVDRGEVIERFGEKVALAADTEGSVTVAEGADAEEEEMDEDMQSAVPVSEYGVYKVQDESGREHIGAVIPGLLDADGTEVPLSLFTNGSVAAIQSDVIGAHAGDAWDLPTADAPSGKGFFYTTEGGEMQATIPLTIQSSSAMPGEPTDMQAETFDGRPVVVSIQPNIQTVIGTDDKMLIPEGWQWSPLGEAEAVNLVAAEEDAPKEASARRKFASVEVRSGGADTFSISGFPVEKLAYSEREMISLDDAMFLLSGLGVNQRYGIKKLGQAYAGREPIQVRIGRTIKTAADQRNSAMQKAASRNVISLRKYLFKEAAVIPDPNAVDAVLSLGFINPENIMSFVSYIPVLEEAQLRLCELLLAARLGLRETPTSALEKSIRAMEEVLEGLKIIAFQGVN